MPNPEARSPARTGSPPRVHPWTASILGLAMAGRASTATHALQVLDAQDGVAVEAILSTRKGRSKERYRRELRSVGFRRCNTALRAGVEWDDMVGDASER